MIKKKNITVYVLTIADSTQIRINITQLIFYLLLQMLQKCWGHNSFLMKITSAVAGSMAGVTAVFLTYPLDTIRARLAFQVSGEHIYTGIANAAETIFKTVS